MVVDAAAAAPKMVVVVAAARKRVVAASDAKNFAAVEVTAVVGSGLALTLEMISIVDGDLDAKTRLQDVAGAEAMVRNTRSQTMSVDGRMMLTR